MFNLTANVFTTSTPGAGRRTLSHESISVEKWSLPLTLNRLRQAVQRDPKASAIGVGMDSRRQVLGDVFAGRFRRPVKRYEARLKELEAVWRALCGPARRLDVFVTAKSPL